VLGGGALEPLKPGAAHDPDKEKRPGTLQPEKKGTDSGHRIQENQVRRESGKKRTD